MTRASPRLLILCSQGGMGGTQRVAILLARQFLTRGWRVRTVFPAVPEGGDVEANGALLDWSRAHGVPAETSEAMLHRAAPRTLGSMARLYSLVREEAPDVVNLHYGWSQVPLRDAMAVWLARPGRAVASLHLPVGWDVAGEHARRSTRRAARFLDALVPCARPVARVLDEAGVPRDKLHVIPGGIPRIERAHSREEARARLGLPRDAVVVSSIARMVPVKGQADLVAAAAGLTERHPALHLVLQGDGPERPAVEARARERLGERAHFLAEDADTSVVYAASDIFALPSHEEAWPLVLMEAAFHGLPCVATAVGGVPDEVEHGVTGLLVPAGRPDHLAAALEALIEDAALRSRLGEAARRRAVAEFTDGMMADRYERLFLGEDAGDPAAKVAERAAGVGRGR